MKFYIASGALGWDGKGWPWERPLVSMGFIKPELFTIFTKTLTPLHNKGKYFVCPFPNGVWNNMGLPNRGVKWWLYEVLPTIQYGDNIVLSITPDVRLNEWDIDSLWWKYIDKIEINFSCPNVEYDYNITYLMEKCLDYYKNKDLILYAKIGVVNQFEYHTDLLKEFDGITINSIPAKGMGYNIPGALSGKIIQDKNWALVKRLKDYDVKNVIAPSIWDYEDIDKIAPYCDGVSFGSIHLLHPMKPTRIVEKYNSCQNEKNKV